MKKDYFELCSNKKFKLSHIPVKIKPRYGSDEEYTELLNRNRACIEEGQTLLYANHSRSLLIIFQGMDTAGKDGAIKHVMSGVNPQGCSVTSFKTPTSNELEHDYLWRANRVLPTRGQIGIFNRSYYEEALITRVHPKLLDQEKLPTVKEHGDKFWKRRYHEIENYEKYLYGQGFEIVKIFIHISKDEQKRRLMDRFGDPKKLWKISEGDVHERFFWKEYQFAYEECIRHTTSKHAPWYIVPSDDKKNSRLIISQILAKRFNEMNLKYPKLTQVEEKKLKALKSLLKKE